MVDQPRMNKGGTSVMWLPLVFLVLLLFVPLVDIAAVVTGYVPPGRRYQDLKLELGSSDFVSGSFGAKIEEYFQGRSVLYHGTGAFYNECVFRLTGRVPGMETRPGGWLFQKSNLTELESETVDERVNSNRDFVLEVRRRCIAPETKLLIAIIPNRSRLYSDLAFPDGEPRPERESFLPRQVAAFSDAGILTINLMEVLSHEVERGRDVFFAEDHHWNFHGSQVAAAEVARWLGTKVDTSGKDPAREYTIVSKLDTESPNRSFTTLLKFRKKSQVESEFLHDQEILDITPDWKEMAPHGAQGAGLVLESSFGMFGFSQFLEESLGVKIDSHVDPGNGSVFALAHYLSLNSAYSDPYPFLLWVIPEYHLLDGLVNQGAGSKIKLPEPFSEEECSDMVMPDSVKFRGIRKVRRKYITESSQPRIDLSFPEPVSGVRLSFRCVGGAKRGQILCPPDSDSGLLLFPRTKEPIHYDLRFTEPKRQVEIKLLFFSGEEYLMRDFEVSGILPSHVLSE